MSHPLVLHCHGHPGSDDIIHYHVEMLWGYDSDLRCTPCGREGRSVEAILSWHHLLEVPEGVQDSTQARACAASLQCPDGECSVHGVIVLP